MPILLLLLLLSGCGPGVPPDVPPPPHAPPVPAPPPPPPVLPPPTPPGSLPPTVHTTLLTWDANTEPDLAGYRLYRMFQDCSALGPPQPIADIPLDTLLYQDSFDGINSVVCYDLTAFDTSGNESLASLRVGKTF